MITSFELFKKVQLKNSFDALNKALIPYRCGMFIDFENLPTMKNSKLFIDSPMEIFSTITTIDYDKLDFLGGANLGEKNENNLCNNFNFSINLN